jgi:FAD/FMN-containing dehydrogenase
MFWDLREAIAPASTKYGYNIKFDMSLPGPLYYDIVEQLTKKV